MMGKIEVALYQPHGFDRWNLVIFRELEDGRVMVFGPTVVEDRGVVWSWEEVAEGDVPPPSLMIPRKLDRQVGGGGLMQEIAATLKREGFEAPGRDSDEKELKAVKEHLDDMQKIIFEFDLIELKRETAFEPVVVNKVREEEPDAEV